MKRHCTAWLLGLLIFGLLIPAFGQEVANPPFWNEIQQYKKQDSKNPPAPDAILFVGSSSIRLWKDLVQHFPEHTVINRGFGGSTLVDLQRYLPDIVLPYQPKQIIIYSGENDVATGKVKAQDVLERFKVVFEEIRQALPNTHIAFIAMKPSPSRARYLPVTAEANGLIKAYLQDKPQTEYVDIYTPMLNQQGQPDEQYFVKDMLHMNEKGYQLWRQALDTVLVD